MQFSKNLDLIGQKFLICVYNIALFMLLGWDEEYIKKNHMLQTSNVSASQNVGDEMT